MPQKPQNPRKAVGRCRVRFEEAAGLQARGKAFVTPAPVGLWFDALSFDEPATTSSKCARGVVWECLASHARNIESFAAGLQTGSLLESVRRTKDLQAPE
jgi:hypothetical protein